MAKKDVGKSDEPVITSLPLPSSDSVLVIDLPDGQKLLVGKMAPGSVIEVATWRGTGRPDSRTNRLMLGMSNGETVETTETSQVSETTSKVSAAYALYIFRNIPAFLSRLVTNIVTRIRDRKNIAPQNAPDDTTSEDIEAWLSKITSSVNKNEVLAPLPSVAKNSAHKTPKKAPGSRKTAPKKQVKKR